MSSRELFETYRLELSPEQWARACRFWELCGPEAAIEYCSMQHALNRAAYQRYLANPALMDALEVRR